MIDDDFGVLSWCEFIAKALGWEKGVGITIFRLSRMPQILYAAS